MDMRASVILALVLMLAAARGVAQPAAEAGAGIEADGAPAVAVFAGGCFWCVEEAFDAVPGVRATISGFAGGTVANPTYEQVSAGGTGHVEAVRVVYDPAEVSYADLLATYWRNIDPIDAGGQFCDRGAQYRSAIFTTTPEQEALAEASKAKLDTSGRLPGPVVTEIRPLAAFYPAEEAHQDYHRRNPLRYKFYKFRCGRERRLSALWDE
jgi:peptide-methionine (S)-S-oxide reductase